MAIVVTLPTMSIGDSAPSNRRQLWLLFVTGLTLHGVVDPGMTYLIVRELEVGVEANPLIRAALTRGPLGLLVFHLPLYAFATACFGGVMILVRLSSGRAAHRICRLARAVLLAINGWGLCLVGWNLTVFFELF